MKTLYIVAILAIFATSSCLNLEEEPIVIVSPSAQISAHIKNKRIYATAQINVNPDILAPGNIQTHYNFRGELTIFNTRTGNPIDISGFSGGGLSQVYTVSADTASHQSLVVTVDGVIEAWADIGGDGDPSNDKLISTGEFHNEAEYILSEFIGTEPG